MSREPLPRGVLLDPVDVPLVLAMILFAQEHWDTPHFRARDRVRALVERLTAVCDNDKGGGAEDDLERGSTARRGFIRGERR